MNQAIAAQKSEAPVKAIEQRANLRSRLAVHLAKGKTLHKATPALEPLDMIITSWRALEGLSTLQGKCPWRYAQYRAGSISSAARPSAPVSFMSAPTRPPLLVFGSPIQKPAEINYLPPADRNGFPGRQIDWLEESARYYRKAQKAAPGKGYALTNWLTMCALVRLRDGTIADKDGAAARADRAKATAFGCGR